MVLFVIYRSRTFLTLFVTALLSLSCHFLEAEETDAKTKRFFDLKISEAKAAFEKSDFTLASKKVAEAEALVPDDATTINLRGAILFREKKYDEALKAFRALIDKVPNSYPGYFNVAEVLLAQKKYDESLASFELILQARPGDEACLFRIALLYALKGDLGEAHRRVDRIPNPGQTAAYYYANAAIEFVQGKTRNGEDWIKKSEMFFPAESSKDLRIVLLENGLIKS